MRLGEGRIHHLAVLSATDRQFDDIAIGVAEIDRADKAVVDRAPDFPALGSRRSRIDRKRVDQAKAEEILIKAAPRNPGSDTGP